MINNKLLGGALFAVTAAVIALVPLDQSKARINPLPGADPVPVTDASRVEVVFVLDTTGSMSGLIGAAKEKIWSVASSLAQAESAPEIHMGLVAFRDRGDSYVTRVTGLSSDLDSVYATLMDYRAGGGGDTPESVNRALHDALTEMAWSDDQGVYRAIFLVGDAPPHMDYPNEPQYPQIVTSARQRGIVINTIQAGSASDTRAAWQRIASLGGGDYFGVDPSGSTVALTTPYDEKLARLSEELDATRLYYGDTTTRAEKAEKLAATRKLHATASVEARARRATFNATESGSANLLGDNELVADVANGRVELDGIDQASLPPELQGLAPAAAASFVEEKARQRQVLQAEIKTLSEQRREYLKEKVEEAGGAAASLDDRIYSSIREQAGAKGFVYDRSGPDY
jgi:Mg-chelatase subunit ChlD